MDNEANTLKSIVSEFQAISLVGEQQALKALRFVARYLEAIPLSPKTAKHAFRLLGTLATHPEPHLFVVSMFLLTHLTLENELSWTLTYDFVLANLRLLNINSLRAILERVFTITRGLPGTLSWSQLACIETLRAIAAKIISDYLPFYIVMGAVESHLSPPFPPANRLKYPYSHLLLGPCKGAGGGGSWFSLFHGEVGGCCAAAPQEPLLLSPPLWGRAAPICGCVSKL